MLRRRRQELIRAYPRKALGRAVPEYDRAVAINEQRLPKKMFGLRRRQSLYELCPARPQAGIDSRPAKIIVHEQNADGRLDRIPSALAMPNATARRFDGTRIAPVGGRAAAAGDGLGRNHRLARKWSGIVETTCVSADRARPFKAATSSGLRFQEVRRIGNDETTCRGELIS